MNEQQMNQMLSREDTVVPSSGFVVAVMDAVRAEASAPPPIAFPWKRALPGLAAGMAAIVLLIVAWGAQLFIPSPNSGSWAFPGAIVALSSLSERYGLVWIALGLLTATVSTRVCMRIARGKG